MLRAVTAALVLIAAPALADPATPEGAAAIETALRSYIGPAPGVVAVTPAGDSYRATLDFTPYAAMLPGISKRRRN